MGGTGKTKETKLEAEKQSSIEKVREEATVSSSKASVTNVAESRANEPKTDSVWQKNDDTTFNPGLSTMMSAQFDQQAALIAMQQQEHELKTATTLSHQNEQVTQIVENQRAKLDEQGKMFNVLIKHQLERQAMLETQMKIQQARIDHYIQVSQKKKKKEKKMVDYVKCVGKVTKMAQLFVIVFPNLQTLMSQPTSLPTGSMPDEKSTKESEKQLDETFSAETCVKKLELEKLHLENTIEILKEKHENEITILQESYE